MKDVVDTVTVVVESMSALKPDTRTPYYMPSWPAMSKLNGERMTTALGNAHNTQSPATSRLHCRLSPSNTEGENVTALHQDVELMHGNS